MNKPILAPILLFASYSLHAMEGGYEEAIRRSLQDLQISKQAEDRRNTSTNSALEQLEAVEKEIQQKLALLEELAPFCQEEDPDFNSFTETA